jgi:hypothetical protein
MRKQLKEIFFKGERKKYGHHLIKNYRWYYRGNLVVKKNKEGLLIDSCGWLTITTKNIINSVGVPCNVVKGKYYLNGNLWEGEQVCIN